MASAFDGGSVPHSPIDPIEEMIAANDWPFGPSNEQKSMAAVDADWRARHRWFAGCRDPGVLRLWCAFDAKAPEDKRGDARALIASAGDTIRLGQLATNDGRGSVVFRRGRAMSAEAGPSPAPYRTLAGAAVHECGRCDPAFQLAIWGGKGPADAIAAALPKTRGEA